jgi:hypothetical protein
MNIDRTVNGPLAAHLLDLLDALEDQNIPLILVGGFGLFLRREWLLETGTKTLFERIPESRATEDFDLVLHLELLADLTKMTGLRAAFDALGYRVVENAQIYQFIKPGTAWGNARDIKIDLLARKPGEGDPKLKTDSRRVKPSEKNSPLHAHITPEAIAVEDDPLEIELEGSRTDGTPARGKIFLPCAYAMYLMKLFAFRDEHEGVKPGDRERYATKHALDLYTITALLTLEERDGLSTFQKRYGNHPIAREAGQIVKAYFVEPNAMGVLRLRDNNVLFEPANLTTFLALLGRTFPADD